MLHFQERSTAFLTVSPKYRETKELKTNCIRRVTATKCDGTDEKAIYNVIQNSVYGKHRLLLVLDF